MDSRDKKLSSLIVNYSVNVQRGEKVLIEYENEICVPLIKQLIRDIYTAGGLPYVNIRDSRIIRELCMGCTEEQLRFQTEYLVHQGQEMDCFIGVRAFDNVSELSDVPAEKMNLYSRINQPTRDCLIDGKKWSVLKYPNPPMAQLADMSEDAFTDFYYQVCTLDYAKMSRAMDPLVDLMNRTDRVHITGPGTDLTFSIKGIGAVKCDGKINIPDGEIYTAPVKDSVNGTIAYNTPSQEQGYTYEKVRFEVKDGIRFLCRELSEAVNRRSYRCQGGRNGIE